MDAATEEQDQQKAMARAWFTELRDAICADFEAIEDDHCGQMASAPAGRFERTTWQRESAADDHLGDGGGGVMSVMRGRVFEKVGVNISMVHGEFSEKFRGNIAGAAEDPRFWAAGISLVAHPHSPHVPPVHMNTRHIITTKWWFGGGADLNPIYPHERDTAEFHAAFKAPCDDFGADYYDRYKAWCDEYFWLPHRNEARGVGGIFYDNLADRNWRHCFDFTQAVGRAFRGIYPALVRRHMDKPWSADERAHQLFRRGRYVEFNLLYDRGTRFGLETGGNTEAILMSLPPTANWP